MLECDADKSERKEREREKDRKTYLKAFIKRGSA